MRFILAPTTIILVLLNCVYSLKLDVASKHVHTKVNTTITIMCKADGPIEECQFTWKNQLSLPGPLIDFKLGPASPAGTSGNNYSYSGAGLQEGDCGITMQISRWTSRIVGCRARAADGQWKYEYVVVTADSFDGFPMTVNPTEIIAKVGDSVTMVCTAPNQTLTDCIFSFPNNTLLRFNHGHSSKQVNNNTRYEGEGLDKGQCGIFIQHVAPEHNGWILCQAKKRERKSLEVLVVPLIVAEPPTSLDLQVEKNPIAEGEYLKATCQVPSSRPPPNITWYFGAEILRKDQQSDGAANDDWAWIDTPRSIIQTIERNVSSRDNGKELRCHVDHIGLSTAILKSERISIKIPPRCPPLTSGSVYILCVWNNDLIGCHEPVPPGTVARLQCKTGFVAPVPHPGFTDITCMDNGEWNRRIYECITDCGRRNTNGGETLIYGAYPAKIGEFPWHVAIYEKIGGTYQHICGGSLIAPDVVLSAAHCFWDNQMGVKKDKSLYKVSAGKYYRDLDAQEDSEPQTKEVRAIIIPERYKGRDSNFVQDIAQIRLVSFVQITARVSTVCIDWERTRENFDLYDGVNGTVAGWGFTASGEQSTVLEAVDLPFVPFPRCHKALPQTLKQILTDDKFCAGYMNKSISVCRGDSGGGLVFLNPKTERYYIRGIVSISFKPPGNTDKCYAQLYTAFTLVSRYHEWLQIPFVS